MKQVEFAKDFTNGMRYSFPNVNVKRTGTSVMIFTPLEAVEVYSLRDVVTIRHAYNNKVDTYTTDWKKHFKPNMVTLSVEKVASLLKLS